MRVLHLTISFARGGRRRAITTLIERLRGLGVACDLGLLDELGCAPQEIAGLAEAVHVLGRRSLFDWRALRALGKLCDTRGIDVIHAHDAAAQLAGALVRLTRPRLPLLMTFHRSLGFESARRRDRLRNALAGLLSGAIVTGSRERRAHFLRENWVNSRKLVRIPFGVDTARFRPDPEARAALRREQGWGADTVVCGAVGHFGPEKGIDLVARGFADLARRAGVGMPVLVILGEGTPAQREMLEDLTRQLAPEQVLFAGFRPDVERWFQAFDVFIHAPRQEAFGLVVAEAMATALPVVATRVGGIPDLVRDGQTGLLVPPEQPDQLADALERLVRDPEARTMLGREGLRSARGEYDADLYARRHRRLYEDLLARRRPQVV